LNTLRARESLFTTWSWRSDRPLYTLWPDGSKRPLRAWRALCSLGALWSLWSRKGRARQRGTSS
jgi:hypothetical protein